MKTREELISAIRKMIKEKYQLSNREVNFIDRLSDECKPLPEQLQKRLEDYLKVFPMSGKR